jgi:cold shock CspA family protein
MQADARSANRVEGGRIGGDMLWFNNEKGHGFIETAAGDRLRVEGSGFRNGPPEGRCAGMPVTFHIAGDGEAARALDVAFPEDAAPRRARIRRSAGR